MPLELTALPYDRTALEPHLSGDTVDQHHGRHQRALIERINALNAGGEFEEAALETIVRKAQGELFDCAAQAWNNAFYWRSLRPAATAAGVPSGALADAIQSQFGDTDTLRQRFDAAALRHFGAGWVWLVQRPDGRLGIAVTANAATPLTGEDTPLLAASLWEHAAYLDYRDDRRRYLDAFWQLVNWDSVAARLRR
ncbi:superoxide dismutase [Luteimonas deserti]|uniref:Superoxide dismutase n=1 Tax=Luteimonas deserti TaxID=2752306 RepID=A0A7Z0TYT9_9GAMM|nr:Fe-Mn family superoxide dismutase [Luteimonas deserti]NYZ62737.1 superoxide dismutase [Luteimonas deserti]